MVADTVGAKAFSETKPRHDVWMVRLSVVPAKLVIIIGMCLVIVTEFIGPKRIKSL